MNPGALLAAALLILANAFFVAVEFAVVASRRTKLEPMAAEGSRAARTALGPELPAAYSNDGALLEQLRGLAAAEHDPLWPMPLWCGYDEDLASKIADLNNVSASAFAGSIIGALFLRRFVTASPRWLHIDLYAWNPKERPGRPAAGMHPERPAWRR